jgi:hypothetical protein
MERFSLKKLDEVKGKERDCIEISNPLIWTLIELRKLSEYKNFC